MTRLQVIPTSWVINKRGHKQDAKKHKLNHPHREQERTLFSINVDKMNFYKRKTNIEAEGRNMSKLAYTGTFSLDSLAKVFHMTHDGGTDQKNRPEAGTGWNVGLTPDHPPHTHTRHSLRIGKILHRTP